MGATASSAQQDSRCEEDAAPEEQTAGPSDARDDANADDKLLQTKRQISSLNIKTKNHADELNGHFEERVLADVGSGFVTIKEDGTIDDLHDVDTLQPNTQNESREMVNSDGVSVEGMEEDGQVNDINEVGFKKIFRFVGFKFTLKKDTCEKTEGEGLLPNEQVEKVASTSEYFEATKVTITEAAYENSSYENTPDDPLNSAVSAQPEGADPSQKTENVTKVDQEADIGEHNVEVTPFKEQEKVAEASPESEEPISPIKQFFTEGFFASLRKKKKEAEIQKDRKEEELKIIDQIDAAKEAEQEGSKCICIDIPHIISEENDLQEKGDIKFLPEEELQKSLEKDKVQGSPLKRLFRKFSTRRQRENKTVENVIEAVEKVSEQPESSSELPEVQKVEKPLIEEPKSSEEEQLADVNPQDNKKKSDSTVTWEALVCGGSARKRARKANENETPDKGEEHEKKIESPLGSSFEGDYDHLTSSSEQAESPGEGEVGSTWKTFKKMVSPKRKVRTGESSSPEPILSDSEMNKDDSFSKNKHIPGHKKRKSDAMQEQTSYDEPGKDAESGDEDDETPAIIPLSEYEIIEPESLRELNEKLVEITIEHEMTEMTSQVLDKDKPNESEPTLAAKVSNNVHVPSENFEELTDFMSKHQQLNDIPEEGIEESIEMPISSAECTTHDDSFAEDFVVPASEALIGEDTTEMVSAVSQLTESPKISGHVTPVAAEYSIQKSDVILQEAVQSMCMIPSVQSVTTKDDSQESLAVSLSPYILQSSTPEETKVLVAHKKTDATAICTGLISQEIESLEEYLPAPLVEEVPEVSDAVLTELVSENLTDIPEVAGLGIDNVYEAEIMEVKTNYKKQIITNATETELNIEQEIQLMAEQDKEECPTEPVMGIEPVYVAVIDTIQREAVLDQVIAENIHDPETEGPLHPVLEESVYIQPVHYTEVTAEVKNMIKLPDDELSTAEFEQAALPEVLEFLTHYVGGVPDTTRSEAADIHKEGNDIFASTVECLETKYTISPISDPIKAEVIEVEDRIQTELVESVHDDFHEMQLDIKDTVLKTAGAQVETVIQVVSAGDSAIVVEDICEQIQEIGGGKMEQQKIEDIHVEESMDVVASEDFQNFDAENISGTAAEFFDREELQDKQLNIPAEEVSLPETVLVEETEEVDIVTTEPEEMPKELDTYVEDKVEEDACDKTDRKGLNEEEELAVKEKQPLTYIEADESENLEVYAHTHITEASPEIIENDVGTENAEMVSGIIEDSDVSESSKDVLEHKETTAEPEAKSEVMLTHLETAVPQVETKPIQTEIMDFQTELSLDSEQSPETSKEDKQTITTENIKTVKVLEMVGIIENVTKQSEMEKLVPVAQALVVSELTKVTEKDNDALAIIELIAEVRGGDQVDQASVMVATEIIKTSAPEDKDKTPVVTEPQSSGPTEIEVAGTTACESVGVAQNYTATQNEVNSVSKHKDESTEDTMLKCEPAEQVVEKPLAIKLQIENVEIKDEIPPVMDMKEESSPVTKLEVAPISQTLPLSSEIEAKTLEVTELKTTLEVTEPKVETHVATEVEVETALEVETPLVTSLVAELEVDSPVVTSMTKTVDTHSSSAISENQNKDTDTAFLTEESKEQVVGIPTLTPVVLTPAEALDVVTTVAALGNGSRPVTSVKDIQDLTLLVCTQAVDPVAVSTVEMHNVTPVVKTLALSSGIVTDTTPPEVVILTVNALSKTSVVSSVVETPVMTPVVDTTTVAPPVEIPIETPELKISTVGNITVALTATPMVETSVVSVTNIEMPRVAMPAVTPVTETSVVSPVVKTTVASTTSEITSKPISVAETLDVTPVNTPDVVSVTVTEAIAPVIYPSHVTPIAETSVTTTVVETPAVKPVIVTEIPTVTPVVVAPLVTPLAETSVVSPVAEHQALKSVAVTEIPDVTSVGMTPALASVIVTGAASTVVTLAVTAKSETSAVSPVVDIPLVMPTAVAVAETPVVTPVVVTPAVTQVAETSVVTPVDESPAVKPVTMKETSVVIPVEETIAVKPVAMRETPVFTPVVVTPAVTPIAQISLVMPVVECPTSKPVVVAEKPVVTQAVEIPAVKPVAMTETPVVTQDVESAAIKRIAVTETPLVTPVVESPAVKPVTVTDSSTVTAAVVVKPVVTPVAETSGVIPGEETPAVNPVAVAETPVIEILAVKPVEITETPVVTPLAEASVVTPVVKTPAVKPVAVAETPDVTSMVVTPALVSVIVTEATSPVLTLTVIAKAETSIVSQVVETPKVMQTAVAETPVLTPVVVTPALSPVAKTAVVIPVLEIPEVKPVATPVVVTSAVTPVAETPLVMPVVEIPAKRSVTMTQTTDVTPVVETPAIKPVAEIPVVTPVVVTPAVSPVAETSVVIPVLGTPEVKPVAMAKRPVLTPVVVTSAVTPVAETPLVMPVVENPAEKSVAMTQTPIVAPVVATPVLHSVIVTQAASSVFTPAVTAIADKSIVSPVVETPAVKLITVAETPVVTPVLQTSALVTVIESVATLPVISPAVSPLENKSVESPVVETPAVKPVADTSDGIQMVVIPTVIQTSETSVVSPVVQIRAVKPSAVTVDETPVVNPEVMVLVDQMASTPVTSIVPSVFGTPVIKEVVETPTVTSTVEKPAKAPVLGTPSIASVVVTPVVKEKMAELSDVSGNYIKPQLVTEKEVKTSVLTEGNAKGSLQHESIVTSTDLQSEVEEDVWEDAVDNIGDAVLMQADGVPKDTAAEDASDAPI